MMGENAAGSVVVGSVSGGDVSVKGVGGGEGGGGSSLTNTHEKQKLISKVQIVGARIVWGSYEEGDYNLVPEIDNTKALPPNLCKLKRKPCWMLQEM